MENNPSVSVIMNCYNSDKYLREAIESVLNQTYENFEIIFWDNHSTDNSANIVNSYQDSRIKYYYATEFTPLGKARNLAIDKTTGEWIAFLDCDDMWEREKLRYSFEELKDFQNRDNISLIYSRSVVVNAQGKTMVKNNKVFSGKIHDILLRSENFIVFSSIIVRKDILLQNGKIDEQLNFCEDYDLLLKVTKKNLVIGMDQFLTKYRMHEENISSKKVYANALETIHLLENYMSSNNLSLLLKIYIIMNNSYRVVSTLVKSLLKREYKNSLYLLKNYLFYIIISPFSILYKKLGY